MNNAFIIGTGRCGSSLLGQMLNSHSEICVPPELQILFEYDDNGSRLLEEFSLNETDDIGPDKLSSLIKRCCPHKLELFYDYYTFCHRDETSRNSLPKFIAEFYSSIAKSHGKSWLIEQTPWYGQRLDILSNMFPNAKFIHVVRDGRDVALSFSRTPWWYSSVYLNLARWQREVKKILVDAAVYLNNTSYLEVKYENLVNNTESEVNRICDFLGINFELNMIDPQKFIDYDKYSRFDIAQISSKEYSHWKKIKEKKKTVFSGNVQAWKREVNLFSDDLPIDVFSTLCRYGYIEEIEVKTSDSDLSKGHKYTVTDHINSLEGKLEKAKSIQVDWNARGDHIVELEKHVSDLETELMKFKKSIYGRSAAGLIRMLSFIRNIKIWL